MSEVRLVAGDPRCRWPVLVLSAWCRAWSSPGCGLPPFIVTLAGLTGVRGLVFFITNEGNDHPSVPGQQVFETLGTG